MKLARVALGVMLALGMLAAPFAATAQPADRVARVGYLAAVTGSPKMTEAFRQGLRDHGYVEGRNLTIEFRDAKGDLERLPMLAAELVALKVDVIFAAGGTPGALAAKNSTRTIPVVFGPVSNPVTSGLVTSLARPGANVTGVSLMAPEIAGKSVEQLKRAVPQAKRVAILWQPRTMPEQGEQEVRKEFATAAQALGIQLQIVEADTAQDFNRAFTEIARARAEALLVHATPAFVRERRWLMEQALKSRLPTISWSRDFVDAGGLMSYGPNFADLLRRAGTYVARILKGARPGDLPVEQPTTLELVINQKTARALGLTIPPSLLLRADQIIE